MRRLEAAGYANVGKTNLHEFAYGISSQNPHFGTVPNPAAPAGSRADRAAGTARRWPRASPRSRSAPTRPGRSASPRVVRGRRVQADWGSCRSTAASRSRRATTTPGRWRDRRGVRRAMRALAPGFEPTTPSSRNCASASRGQSSPTRSCAHASRRPRRASQRRRSRLPLPEDDENVPRSCTRPPTSTATVRGARRLVRRQTSARRSRRASGSPTPTPARAGERGGELRERFLEATDGVDLVLTPTIPFVAPLADADEDRVPPARDQPHVSLQPARLACARAPVRSRRGRPAGVRAARGQAGGRRARPRRRGIPRSRDSRALGTAETPRDGTGPPPRCAARSAVPGHVGDSGSRRDEGRSAEPPRVPLPRRRAAQARVFAHAGVRVGSGARRAAYEFELATSSTFRENGIIYSDSELSRRSPRSR